MWGIRATYAYLHILFLSTCFYIPAFLPILPHPSFPFFFLVSVFFPHFFLLQRFISVHNGGHKQRSRMFVTTGALSISTQMDWQPTGSSQQALILTNSSSPPHSKTFTTESCMETERNHHFIKMYCTQLLFLYIHLERAEILYQQWMTPLTCTAK